MLDVEKIKKVLKDCIGNFTIERIEACSYQVKITVIAEKELNIMQINNHLENNDFRLDEIETYMHPSYAVSNLISNGGILEIHKKYKDTVSAKCADESISDKKE